MKKKNLLPPTSKRVCMKTDPQINDEIRNQTVRNLNIMKNCNETELTERIQVLNHEWDTERVLEVNASLLVLIGSYLGVKTGRIWFVLTAAIGIFMLQHATIGWCPPMPIIRKWGVRTAEEIGAEKTVLKIVRGDYTQKFDNVSDALNMVDKE